MKNTICILAAILMANIVFGQIKEVKIKGSISDGISKLSDVNVKAVEDGKGTKTDKNGNYIIEASEGSTLKYSHIGFENIEIQLEDYDRTLNIVMIPKIEVLDDVTVTQKIKNRKTQEKLFLEYNTNPNLIKTKFGIQDKKVSGTAMYVIEDKDINPVALNILGVIQGKAPGASISPRGNPNVKTHVDDPNAVIYLRGGDNEKPAIYDIDGQIFEDTPLFLNVNNIKRIAVLPSLFSATLYGTIGRGGVISINTKSGNFSPENVDSPNYNQALVRDNTFENDAIEYSLLANAAPVYLTELMSAETLEDAKTIYSKHYKNYKSTMYFVLDAYEYFYNKGDARFADNIIKTNKAHFENNPITLKTLAYLYQSQGRFKNANEIYKQLFIIRPNYSQSYIDLANSYREVNEIKKAGAIYARYIYLLDEGFIQKEQDFNSIMNREYNNLLGFEARGFLNKRAQKKIIQNKKIYTTRLVFEWNDSEAEFELQFVNPNGKYFKHEHSFFADADLVRSQKIAGFSMQEHLIDDSMIGQWQVNVKYLGNKSLTPTYLKATIYKNYGSSQQNKETKLFKLGVKNSNQKLFTVVNTPAVVVK